MIIDAKTILLTLLIVGVASYFGLNLIRSFALSIAQENHDANLAMDMTEQSRRAKRERLADEAASAAYAKVEPLLPSSVIAKKITNSAAAAAAAGSSSGHISTGAAVLTETTPIADATGTVLLSQLPAPSSGNLSRSVT